MDFVEIGPNPIPTGTILPLRVLGSLCLLDQGEVDWKLVCMRDYPDFESHRKVQFTKEKVEEVRDWFERYKTYDGKPKNKFAFNGELLDVEKTKEIIEVTHQAWKDLKDKGRAGYWTGN